MANRRADCALQGVRDGGRDGDARRLADALGPEWAEGRGDLNQPYYASRNAPAVPRLREPGVQKIQEQGVQPRIYLVGQALHGRTAVQMGDDLIKVVGLDPRVPGSLRIEHDVRAAWTEAHTGPLLDRHVRRHFR